MTRLVEEKDLWYLKENLHGRGVLLTEPYLLHPENYIELATSNAKFVLCNHQRFVNRYENWYYYPLGGCHVPEEDRMIHKKTKNVSMFISHKKTMPGHILRHTVYNNLRNHFDVYGEGFNYVENKADGLREYRFSIVIESCREPGYFTEKIIDCILTGTIPIYWGDPNIGDFFNEKGILLWDGEIDTLFKILDGIEQHGEEMYEFYMVAGRRNFPEARDYTDYKKWIAKHYKGLLND